MGPALPIIALALLISACSTKIDKGGGGGGDGDTDVDTDTDTDVDTDSGTDSATDTGTEPYIDPCDEIDYLNGQYFKCERGGNPCSMIDVDVHSGVTKLMVDYPVNRLARITIANNGPMGYAEEGEEVSAQFGGDMYSIGQSISSMSGLTDIYPIQSDLVNASDNLHAVSFMYESTVYPGTEDEVTDADVSGMAFLDGSHDPTDNPQMVQGINPITLPYEMYLVGIQSADIYSDGANDRIALAASEYLTGNGVYLSYNFNSAFWLQQSSVDFPAFTSGRNPSAVAKLDDEHIAVVNPKGWDTEIYDDEDTDPENDPPSFQVKGASIDIFDTTISAETGDPKVANIPLGPEVELLPFPEFHLTDDKSVGVVVGGTGDSLTTLYTLDMVGNTVAGSLDLSDLMEHVIVSGIAIHGNLVALSIHGKEHSEASMGGHVVTIDISDPANPSFEKVITDVGFMVGALDMHEEDDRRYIYVATQASFCEDPPESDSDPFQTLVSIDYEDWPTYED